MAYRSDRNRRLRPIVSTNPLDYDSFEEQDTEVVPINPRYSTPELGSTRGGLRRLSPRTGVTTGSYSGEDLIDKPVEGQKPNYTMGAIAAAPGVVGGLSGAIAAQVRLNNLTRQDLTPQEVKEGYADAGLRANSSKAADYAQEVEDINAAATKAGAGVNAGATTGSQAVRGAGIIQSNTNRAMRRLRGAGLNTQDQRRQRLDNYRKLLGEYKTMSNNQYNNERSALYNARAKGYEGAANSATEGALLAMYS